METLSTKKTLSGTTTIKNFTTTDCTGQVSRGSTKPGWIPVGDGRQFNFPVKNNGGGRITTGIYDSIKVWCDPEKWSYLGGLKDPKYIVSTPEGQKDFNWMEGFKPTFPNAYRHGVVIFQVTKKNSDNSVEVNYHQVIGTSEKEAIVITFDKNLGNLYVAVNDSYVEGEKDYNRQYEDNNSKNSNNTITAAIGFAGSPSQ